MCVRKKNKGSCVLFIPCGQTDGFRHSDILSPFFKLDIYAMGESGEYSLKMYQASILMVLVGEGGAVKAR